MIPMKELLDTLGYNSDDSADSVDNSEVDSEIVTADIGAYIPSEHKNSG